MKKIIIISIILTSQLVLWGCDGDSQETLLTLDEVKGKQEAGGMVDDAREAMQVLKDNDKIDIVKLEDIEGESNSNMIVTVIKKDDQWNIKVKTRTAIPSYSCEYAMDIYGQPIYDDYIVKKCSWNEKK